MIRHVTPILAAVGLAAALTPAVAQQAPPLAQVQSGLWEISGVPGTPLPVRQCLADVTALARFEHRASSCSAKVLKSTGSSASIEYSCGGAGFGHSDIQVITPRSLRISTQGISGGLPFNYVLQARRVENCAKSVPPTRH